MTTLLRTAGRTRTKVKAQLRNLCVHVKDCIHALALSDEIYLKNKIR